MKTSIKTLITTSILALAAGHVVAMNGGTIVPDAEITQTGAVSFWQSGSSMCSGTLLSPTYVLTARHCLVPEVLDFSGGESFQAPATAMAAGGNAGLWSQFHYIMAGWVAPIGHEGNQRQATLTSIDESGHPGFGFGTSGYASIAFTNPAVTSSELVDLVKTPSGDLVAVGSAEVGGVQTTLIARFDVDGHLLSASLPTVGTAAVAFSQVPGRAVRALAVGNAIVVAGWDLQTGVARWRATRYDATGQVDFSFTPYFGSSTPGRLLDVVQVGSRLVWLGQLDTSSGVQAQIAVTDLDGHSQLQLPVDLTMVPNPERLLAHGDAAVWLIGADYTRTATRVARLAVPSLAPDAGWPAHGSAMTAAPSVTAALHVKSAVEDAAHRLIVVGEWDLGKPLAMVARFNADGGPDLSFGQSGLVVMLNHNAQYPGTVLLGHQASTPIIMLGRSDVVDPADKISKAKFWAVALDDQHDRSIGTTVRYGNASTGIARVIRHPDASVDIALVELQTALVYGDRRVAVTAINQVPIAELQAADVMMECRAYGTDDANLTGILRRGEFQPYSTDGQDIHVYGDEPNRIRAGDSGGGCVIERDGVTYLVGVIRASTDEPTEVDPKAKPGTGEAFTESFLTDPQMFTDFITVNVPGW